MYRIEGFRRDMEERISERRDQVSGRQAHTIEERQNQILEMFRQVQQRETMVTLRENGMLERHFQRRDAEPDVD
jgi:hypothetical protein